MKIAISGKARADLARAYTYLVSRNPAAADILLAEINSKLVQLSRFPFLGRERSELAPDLRSAIVRNVVIFYTVADDQIIIMRAIDGRMDVHEEFHR
jgi:toxin ParE1/3/4